MVASQDGLVHIRRQVALAHLFGVHAASISVEEARERWPLMNAEDVVGAVWSPDDGRVSPSDLCAVYTLMLNERGGIESDLVALRLDETQYRLYVGTGRSGAIWRG